MATTQSYDTSTELNVALSSASNTTSFTVGSGTDRALFVWTIIPAAADNLSSVTYDGVALTQLGKIQEPDNNFFWTYFHYLLNPSIGTHDIVQNFSGSNAFIGGMAGSYAGTSAVPGSLVTNRLSVDPWNLGTLVSTPDYWIVGCARQTAGGAGAPTAGSNTTIRYSYNAIFMSWADSNNVVFGTPITTGLSFVGNTGTQSWVGAIAILAPVTAGGTTWPGYQSPFGWH